MIKFTHYYESLNPEIKEYWKAISLVFPRLLIPYIETFTMQRLLGIGYFCAMDYASKDVYDFKFYLSRLEHSISTALIVWNHTYDKKQTLAALFHDAGTPATAHVVDYLNEDQFYQESTERDLEETLNKDPHLVSLLKRDGLKVADVCDYKKYPLVDSKRPKMCADRLDGIFLTSLVWTKTTTVDEIKKIYEDVGVAKNEDGDLEFNFIDVCTADRVVELNDEIDAATHADEDFYSMSLLASMEKYLISQNHLKYEDLYSLQDADVIGLIEYVSLTDEKLAEVYHEWKTMKTVKIDIKPPIKRRIIDPLVHTIRYSHY